jgi:hypothetical protein
MAQLITNNFKVYNAENFITNSNGTDNLYLAIGRPQTWVNENTPPTPINNVYQDLIYSSENLALKRIVPSDLKQVVKRYDWAIGTVYDQYDNETANISTSNFYVLTTPDNNIYKCIYNNNRVASTDKPSGRSLSVITTSDGYKWKFLYSLTDTDLLKFLTNDYMAVHNNDDVILTTIGGTIDSILVTTAGNNYNSNSNVIVSIVGDGTGAVIDNVELASGGGINKIKLATAGSGYTYANVVISTINNDTGIGASARAIIGPRDGHGKNNFDELGANYVMINSRLDYAEGGGDFPVVNDYRRIGIIKNPISNTTLQTATETTLSATYTMRISNVTGTFALDELIYGGNSSANALVVSANANVYAGNVVLRYITPINYRAGNINFRLNEIVRGNTSLAVGTIIDITYPEVKLNSGKVMYVDNRKKISRNPDQAENIHIVIEF